MLASSNPGKEKDYKKLFSEFPIQLIPQGALQIPEVEETGLTFVENAILKARNACLISGLPSIGDDGGLVVDALFGAPGLYSARYAGKNANMEENIHKLLLALKEVPAKDRTARLCLILVYLRHHHDPDPIICEGTWELTVMETRKGTQGFGYLPILYVPTHQCGAAELSLEARNKINHRSQAFHKLIDHFKKEGII